MKILKSFLWAVVFIIGVAAFVGLFYWVNTWMTPKIAMVVVPILFVAMLTYIFYEVKYKN